MKTWGKGKVIRLIGAGAGLIFKGSGFYITDYRSEGYKSAAESASKSESTPSATSPPSSPASSSASTGPTSPSKEATADSKKTSLPEFAKSKKSPPKKS